MLTNYQRGYLVALKKIREIASVNGKVTIKQLEELKKDFIGDDIDDEEIETFFYYKSKLKSHGNNVIGS